MQKLWRRLSELPLVRFLRPQKPVASEPQAEPEGKPIDPTDPAAKEEFKRTTTLPLMGMVGKG